MKDYYEILEVHKKASIEVIKKAYFTLAKKYHPDINQHSVEFATQKMQEINEAYEVLSDPDKRREYDIIYDLAQEQKYKQYFKEPIKTKTKNNIIAYAIVAAVMFFVFLPLISYVNYLKNFSNEPQQLNQYKSEEDNPFELCTYFYDIQGRERKRINCMPPSFIISSNYITIESTKEDVLRIMGEPTSRELTYRYYSWLYDNSEIFLDRNGQVVGWKNYGARLKVSLGEKDENAPHFTIGSQTTDVIKAMGTPTYVYRFGNIWLYNSSTVKFDNNNRVIDWNEKTTKLKANKK